MNKKLLNVILIVLLIMIWTGVVKKFLWNQGEEHSLPANLNPPSGVVKAIKKDTLLFNIKNKHPFAISPLKDIRTVIQKSEPETNRSNVSKNHSNISEPWPELTYYGYVKNENSAFKLILLKFNGKLLKIKENEEIGGLFIEKVKKDSIVLRRGGESKIIKKYSDKF